MVFDKNVSCCFTGHRVMSPSEKQRASEEINRIVRTLVKNGVRHFICGGALGFDTVAAVTLINMRTSKALADRDGNEVKIHLTLAIPCPEQSERWQFSDKALYNRILSEADSVMTVSEHYTKSCMFERNRYMVDSSAYCVAYVTRSRGGAYYTMNYAKKSGVGVINIAPEGEI